MTHTLIGLADRSKRFVYVSGSLVRTVQDALQRETHKVGVSDGIFGKDSSGAMKKWQEKTGRPANGDVSLAEYKTLTGETPEPFEICLQLTASFEGHGFGLAKGDFDGAILTWGIIGFTFAHEEIQGLIAEIDADDEGKAAVATAFGDLEASFRDALNFKPTGPKAKQWSASISEPGNPGKLLPPWRDAFKALGTTKVARKYQLKRARERYWARAEADAKKLDLGDLRGLGLCFDIAVQCGGVDADETATIEQRIAAAGVHVTGQARREIVANVVADAGKNKEWIEDVRSRKLTIATGQGEVHKSLYRMRDWGLDIPDLASLRVDPQDIVPVFVAPATAMSKRKKFDAFFRSLNLKNFRPDEFAFLGQSNQNPNHGSFGKNALPDEELWANMIPTAQIMDRLRDDLNASIHLTSVFRTKAYNTAIGGAENSQHMRFTAVDFFCQNGKGPENWGAKLAEYRKSGEFSGGIGIYPSRHFVHLDTRGFDVDLRP